MKRVKNVPLSKLSRRTALRNAGGSGVALAAGAVQLTRVSAQEATPAAVDALPPEITAVMSGARYSPYTQ